jgi:transcription initiation factor TFIID TATA-box-binding protein
MSLNSADLKFRVNLSKLHIEHRLYCRYDPEVFPGLTYRMKVPDVVLLVFHRCESEAFWALLSVAFL